MVRPLKTKVLCASNLRKNLFRGTPTLGASRESATKTQTADPSGPVRTTRSVFLFPFLFWGEENEHFDVVPTLIQDYF